MKVETPDEGDREWLQQKKRALKERPGASDAEVEQMIGRKQRVTSKMVSISQGSKNLADSLAVIRAAQTQGRADKSDSEAVFKRITGVLSGDPLPSSTDIIVIRKTLKSLDLPQDPIAPGFPMAVVDSDMFRDRQGEILAFVLAHDPDGDYDPAEIVALMENPDYLEMPLN